MDPITMMVASIGMQFFNNYANNKKSEEIQAQQREFQNAAAEHDFERMRKVQAAAAKLALELEAEVHNERLEDIEKNYDTLLYNFAHSFAISGWPLNVLPFIMKGESFGTLLGGTAKSINMHCIFTPSNCTWFNEYFYDDLDLRIEAEMNNHWNAQSSHPIVYYGGGWNRRQEKQNGNSIPQKIDLDDIALLKSQLKTIPTMVITPYFNPYLHFRVQLWGMGTDSEKPFRIEVPQGDIEQTKRIFSYDYNKDVLQELTDDFFNTTMDEFVPYIEKLIGFVADKYFWNAYGLLPMLPEIAGRENILFFDENDKNNQAVNLMECIDKRMIIAHGATNLLNLVKSSIDVNNKGNSLNLVRILLCQVCNSHLEDNNCTPINIDNYLTSKHFGLEDIAFLKDTMSILEKIQSKDAQALFNKLDSLIQDIVSLNNRSIAHFFSYITLRDFLEYLSENVCEKLYDEDTLVLDLQCENRIVSVSFTRNEHITQYDIPSPTFNYRIDGFLIPSELKQTSPKRFKLKKKNLHSFKDKISFDCDTNLFHMAINLDIIVKYCEGLIDKIKSCNLYIKDCIPKDVIKNIDGNLANNLIYCEIESWNHEIVHQLFYFDEMTGYIKEKFLLTHKLIIQ